jgi:hypothetical protein
MNAVCKNILIGSVLGDGWMEKPTANGSSWRLKYDDNYLSYLNWLRVKLKPLSPTTIKAKKNYHQHYFSVKSSKELFSF